MENKGENASIPVENSIDLKFPNNFMSPTSKALLIYHNDCHMCTHKKIPKAIYFTNFT